MNKERLDAIHNLIGDDFTVDANGVIRSDGNIISIEEQEINKKEQGIIWENYRDSVLAWLDSKHSEFIKIPLNNPSNEDVLGWQENVVIAQRFIDSKASADDEIYIKDQLKPSELANNEGVLMWSRLVLEVKRPFAKRCYSVASGVKRRGKELIASVGISENIQLNFDSIKAEIKDDALGVDYDPDISFEQNINAGNIGGKAAELLSYGEQLKAAFAAQ